MPGCRMPAAMDGREKPGRAKFGRIAGDERTIAGADGRENDGRENAGPDGRENDGADRIIAGPPPPPRLNPCPPP
ncbi:MAG TPA: hypothetical protein VM867_12915, partial [Xanthobacteraceae bacterium]|nr:hypothetical protein [Xanthobacteraceae bacterium]